MEIDEICDSFSHIDILCPTENYDEIYDSLGQTKLLIANQNRNFDSYIDERVINHLTKCNFRYLGYSRRNLFTDNKHLDYLNRMMNIFCQKMGNCIQGHNEHLNMLYMAYHIDSMIISQIEA